MNNQFFNGINNEFINIYAKYVYKFMGEHIMPCVGITDDHINNIIEWSYNNNVDKYIFFDWDRTITVVEGIIIPKLPSTYSTYGIDIEDVLNYLLGGNERKENLKNMFNILGNNNVKIYIITNNDSALKINDNKKSKRINFINLIKQLIPTFTDNNLICSFNHKTVNLSGKLKSNKAKALNQNRHRDNLPNNVIHYFRQSTNK